MRSRNVSHTACSVAAAMLLAACGGGEAARPETVSGPKIEDGVASGLAARSDEVARRLESGDPCGAGEEAARLRDELTAAINARQIPELYLEDLSVLVNEIEAQIPACVAPAPPPDDGGDGNGGDESGGENGDDEHDEQEDGDEEEDKGDDEGKGKGKEKGKDKDKGNRDDRGKGDKDHDVD